MSEVMEIEQLVGPLGDYSEGVFKESDNNQEAANCRKIAVSLSWSAMRNIEQGAH